MKRYYLCGPTVYNYPHIGNLRPIVSFDLMIRAQRQLGEDVYFLHNITDIDDKIIAKAKQENKTEKEISSFYEAYYLNLFKLFSIEMPNKIVRVTDSLNDMYEYIQSLIEKGAAYQVNGNVYFDVLKFKDVYGKISNQKLANLISDSSNEVDKRSPYDFALWKDTTEGIKFQSPFGLGRPGWHTECSCFINKYFEGKQLDIHGGGIDLIFPHHENENIQHFAINGQDIAKDWIHFGTLNYKNQKMSKSIGNIIYAEEFLKNYSADTYKLLMLSTSYSKPINITDELLASLQKQINNIEVHFNKSQLENIKYTLDKQIIDSILKNVSNLDFSLAFKQLNEQLKSPLNYGNAFFVFKVLGFKLVENKVSNEDKELYRKWNILKEQKQYDKADEIRNILKTKRLI